MMKTALLLSGQLRNAKENWSSIKRNIVDKYDADVFISTWSDDSTIIDHRGQVVRNDASLSEMLSVYRPKVCEIEENTSPLFDKFNSVDVPKESICRVARDGSIAWESKINNVIFMYYKMHRVYSVFSNYAIANQIKYDRVIRSRFDLRIEEFPSIEPQQSTIYVPASMNHRGGLCDFLSVGDMQSTGIYCNLFETILWRINTGRTMHPESALLDHLELNRISIERFTLEYYFRGWRVE